MTKIKLCGLMHLADAVAANRLKPDFVGFVFAKKSRRYITPDTARQLKFLLSPEIKTVGVFVDEDPEMISALLEEGIIDIVQLHGHEDDAYLQRLRELTGKPLIQAFQIRRSDDLEKALQSNADCILLDAGSGGTGTAFDWSLLTDRPIRVPWFLAGGLNPENAADAIRQLHPWALDVSSGIETDGKKDEKKMTAFVAAVYKEDTKI